MKRNIQLTLSEDSRIIKDLSENKVYSEPQISSFIDNCKYDFSVNKFKRSQIIFILNEADETELNKIINKELTINQLFESVKKKKEEKCYIDFDCIMDLYQRDIANNIYLESKSLERSSLSDSLGFYLKLLIDLFMKKEIEEKEFIKFTELTNEVLSKLDEKPLNIFINVFNKFEISIFHIHNHKLFYNGIDDQKIIFNFSNDNKKVYSLSREK